MKKVMPAIGQVLKKHKDLLAASKTLAPERMSQREFINEIVRKIQDKELEQ